VSLRIGFDLDGVLADMESEVVRQSEILFGRPTTHVRRERGQNGKTAGDAVAPLQMTARQRRRLWRHIDSIDGFWESLNEIEPGAVARLAALTAERRWEVIFLTKRPQTAGATAQVQSQRWLEARGFPLPSVFVVHGSRGRVADSLGLDVVVDDRPENCVDVALDSRARAMLVWRGDENQLPDAARRPGLELVKSVDECLTILSGDDTANRARPGLVARMIRRLGFKEPARAWD
jgi:hypothetical protein